MNRYEFVVKIVQEAGEKVLVARNKHIEVSMKDNNPHNLVTNVDIEVSNFISESIRQAFPGEAIYSEEATDEDVSSGPFWSIDPIDGTALFSRNIPHFSVVVAYVEKGIPLVGAIYNPVTKELFSFEKGRGAFLFDKRVSVSDITELSSASVFFRAGSKETMWDWGASSYRFLLEHANKTSNFGSSALDMCFVGAGRIEASIYGRLTAVDIIAAIGFLREAGGILVGKDGAEIIGLSREPQTIAAVNNKQILAALREGKVI